MNKISQSLLLIDEGRQHMALVDTGTDTFRWRLDLAEFPLARDMQRLDDGHVLVGYDHGFFVLDLHKGEIQSSCARWNDVTAVHRQEDGTTLVTGFNLDGGGGVNVLTLDSHDHLVHNARRDGDYVRLMRKTPSGTYLLCTNDHILETSQDLVEIRRFTEPGFEHAWQAERLPDGRTLVSAGYGAFMAVFDVRGKRIERFGDGGQVPAGIDPFFYASFQRLANGNLLVANWQGHGQENGHKGQQLLEFDAHRRVVGTWSAPERISSLQGVLVLSSPLHNNS